MTCWVVVGSRAEAGLPWAEGWWLGRGRGRVRLGGVLGGKSAPGQLRGDLRASARTCLPFRWSVQEGAGFLLKIVDCTPKADQPARGTPGPAGSFLGPGFLQEERGVWARLGPDRGLSGWRSWCGCSLVACLQPQRLHLAGRFLAGGIVNQEFPTVPLHG